MQHWVEMIFQCMQFNGQGIPDIQISPSGRDWEIPNPLPKKLACLCPPPLPRPSPALLQNDDFVIFIQFLVILPKLSPHKSTSFEKPWISEKSKFKPCHCSCIEVISLPGDLANTFNSKLEHDNCLLEKRQMYLLDNT